MAKNFVQAGESLTIPAPEGGAVSGAPYQVGALCGVFLSTAEAGEPVAFLTEGVFELAKEEGLGLFLGDLCYLVDGEITDSGEGQSFGICVADSDATASTVKVKVSASGPAGPEGPAGPAGPAGPSGL
jgi:predicted RecA/RadA family phage recombinase